MYIRWFKDVNIKDIPSVGGKTASLGEMYSKLTKKGIKIPNGFALTSDAYWSFLKENNLDKKIKTILKNLDVKDVRALAVAGKKVREMILKENFPKEIEKQVKIAYKKLGKNKSVAVRSSATAEDLPDASFAGQQETYLNVVGEKDLLLSAKNCIASLFTNRAISYREDKGFDHMSVALSVCFQEMVRSDLGSSGVMFTLDTESGFPGVVLINSAFGLGEYVVKGRVIPDQFYVYKQGLKEGYKSIISHRVGSKEVKLVYGKKQTKQEKVKKTDQDKFSITDADILQLAKWGVQIENHYGRAMDIEWAKDGKTGQLYIVQARSETVKSQREVNVIETYKLQKKSKPLLVGTSIGQKIGQGRVRIVETPKDMKHFKPGEVLVTKITDPDWEPIMRIAGAIITEQGGKTSHAAIVSRELGVPCLVGAKQARKVLKKGQQVTVSCAEGEEGIVYKGTLPFEVEKTEIKKQAKLKTKVMMNVGDPDNAFTFAAIPNDGVGLAREEFIYSNFIKVHPLALINYKKLKNKKDKQKIKELTVGYKDKTKYAVDRLAEGIAFIASAFAGKDVVLRLSDFKTNEYATLIGGKEFEPEEENPMLGWRGASRYYDKKFIQAFKIECEAIKKVRNEWGLKNVIVMVPFCRTPEEGRKVIKTMEKFGLKKGKGGLKVYVMCELPSNVILAKEFSQIFDGFSIGSNDLTQLTLGVDRDSALVSHIYDENSPAVKRLISDVIKVAHKNNCKVGICGQAPSDYPEFAEFLVGEGIDSISLNPDTVLKTRDNIAKTEMKSRAKGAVRRVVESTASKMLVFLGFVGIVFVLGGYGCQSLNNQMLVDGVKNTINQELVDIKEELKQEVMSEVKNIGKSTYSEKGDLEYSLNYPSNWNVERGDNRIKFVSSNGSDWFTVILKPSEYKIPEDRITNLNIGDLIVERFYYVGEDGGEIQAGLVYDNLDKNPILELNGNEKYFDDILEGLIINFK